MNTLLNASPTMRGLSGAIGMDKMKGGVSLLGKLILLELILSVIFVVLGHLIGNAYFRGVGVGLIISWVTSVLAY